MPAPRRPLLAHAHCHRHTHAYRLNLTHADGYCCCKTNEISSVGPASGAASDSVDTDDVVPPSTAGLVASSG